MLIPSGTSFAAVNCSNFSSQLAAQNYYNAQAGDPDGLDADHDGWACESNPAPRASSPKGASIAPIVTQPVVTQPTCNVPNLKRLTRGKAIQQLKNANCAAGAITKPRKKKKHKTLKVKSQSQVTGTALPAGTKVNFKLGY